MSFLKKLITIVGIVISASLGLIALLLFIVGMTDDDTFMAIFGFVILVICIGFIVRGTKKLILVSPEEQAEPTETVQKIPNIVSYVIVDFETTGLNPKTDRIIQIGAVKVVDGEVVAQYSTYVNPMKNITKRITEINGITSQMVMDAPTEDVAIPELIDFIGNMPITAYNLSFDLSFLVAAINRIGVDTDTIPCFDALRIAKREYPELPNHKLETVVKSISPDYQQNHDALDDCLAVKEILDRTTISVKMIGCSSCDNN